MINIGSYSMKRLIKEAYEGRMREYSRGEEYD